MKNLYLIRGLPGSGKSTLAKRFSEGLTETSWNSEVTHIETDMYWTEARTFDWRLLPEAHGWAIKWCETVMRDTWGDIVVSNTFTQLWEMQPYLDLAKKYDYQVTVLRCEGNYGNNHNVPESTVKKMKARFQDYDGVQSKVSTPETEKPVDFSWLGTKTLDGYNG